MEVVYIEEALQEGLDAARWYEAQSEGLEVRFLHQWKEAEKRMVAAPELYRVFADGLRRCRFEIFPHALIYRIRNTDFIEVVAVMHPARKPGYWTARIGG